MTCFGIWDESSFIQNDSFVTEFIVEVDCILVVFCELVRAFLLNCLGNVTEIVSRKIQIIILLRWYNLFIDEMDG